MNSCSSLYHDNMSSIYYGIHQMQFSTKPVFVYICIIVADPIIKGMVNLMWKASIYTTTSFHQDSMFEPVKLV